MVTKISRAGALEAARDGGEAFRAGKEPSDNPHLDGDDLGDEFLAHHWNKGFVHAQSA